MDEKYDSMNEHLLDKMRAGQTLSLPEQIQMVVLLSIPAILAQISNIIMQYIDASMVGQLGADASAAVGLISSTTWLTGGLCQGAAVGFTVQVAYRIGRNKPAYARETVKYGLLLSLFFSLCLAGIAVLVHRHLPVWLGAGQEIRGNASDYFLIYGLTLPFLQMIYTAGGMLQCSGDMRTPGILHILMCFLDVIFNYFLIFPGRNLTWQGKSILIPGAGLGVKGAALGTALSVITCALLMLWKLLFGSRSLHLRKGEAWKFPAEDIRRDVKVSLPVMVSSMIMGLGYVAGTYIVAPLGTIAIAANSFAVTAESICYMPGYGIASAATTIVGQARGAGRTKLMKELGYLALGLGIFSMTIMAALLYIMAPTMMALLTPVSQVRTAGTAVLRLIVFAEPLFAASIVAEGIFRGLGKTRIPTALILICMWFIRIPLTAILAGKMGLWGIWIGQGIELCIRGILFIVCLVKEG